MPDVLTIIEEAKKALGVESDNAFAKELGITRATVSHWRNGRALPDTVTCATLAGLTGRPLTQVMGIVGEARAISREEKAVWRKLAATAVTLLMGVLLALPAHAQAAKPGMQKAHTLHYAKLPLSGPAECSATTGAS